MALRMEIQTTPGGAYSEVDLAALRACQFRLKTGYSHPRELSWKHYVSQETFPLGIRNFVRFWDDTYGSTSEPQFEGFIWEVNPGVGANEVNVVAYDPTQMAGRDIPIMSLPWSSSTTIGTGATPRLVYNATIDNDDDYAFSRGFGGTVGEIIGGILDDALLPLRRLNAAPAASDAYVSGDLSAMAFIPQEKMVFESETIFSGLERLSQYHPAFKMVWVPGDRQWRFIDLYSTQSITLTLNHFNETSGSGNQFKVLSMQMGRSLEGRYPAVHFFGPETTTINSFYTRTGGLRIVAQQLLEGSEFNGDAVYTPVQFQIEPASYRRGARLLPESIYVPMGSYNWNESRSPSLQFSYDNGVTWIGVSNPTFDFANGIVTLAGYAYIYLNPAPSGTNQNFFPPTDWRLFWANYLTPLNIRWPVSGLEGTSYTVAGMDIPLVIYDESLAVGYERGQPVSTSARLTQFQTLAQNIHAQRKDIIYAGGCVLDGIQYEFQHLGKAVNIGGVDADGDVKSTGWESIGAIVTDVEYDFEERTTTLMFSSDQLELVGIDVEKLKQFLGMRALVRQEFTQLYGSINFNANSFVYTSTEVAYIDPLTGQAEAPIS